MAGPRHLWSGDWERDSVAAAEQLSGGALPRHESPPEQPHQPQRPRQPPPHRPTPLIQRPATPPPARSSTPAPAPAPAPRNRSGTGAPAPPTTVALKDATRKLGAAAADRRRDFAAALAGLAVVAVVVAAVLIIGAQSSKPKAAWLGVEMSSSAVLAGGFQSGLGSFPFSTGVVITGVVPGSPAADAGLIPGDVITQVGRLTVTTPAGVDEAIATLHAGDQVLVDYTHGLSTYTALVTLAPPPGG